jgi:hypothetical protein
MAKIIKLEHKDELASIIKQLKTTKEQEVILVMEEGSRVANNKEAIRLIKKTAEVLGKKLTIEGDDNPATEIKAARSARVARSDIKPPGLDSSRRGGKFSDIMVKRPKVAPPIESAPIRISSKPKIVHHQPTKAVVHERSDEGTRIAFEAEPTRSSKFSTIFILILIVAVIAVFGLAVLLPQANITVFARSEPITRDFEITVDKNVTAANRTTMQIPGISVSKEVSQTKTFPTTGTKVTGTKTGGNVVIYNFTPNTLRLRAATTTLIAGGKKYVLLQDVAGLKPNGAANPNIAIAAAEAGEAYNLPAKTRFQIVNAALGNANVYAENPQALGGGTTVQGAKILSQQDIDNATNSLIAAIISQAEADLTAQHKVQIKLLDTAVKKDILAKTANKEVGAEVETFSMTLIAKVTGLAFREDDVVNVVVSKIEEVLSNDKYLVDGQPEQYNPVFKSVDPTYTKGVLTVHFQTVAAYKVDDQNLTKILAGKTEPEIKEILLSKPEIDRVNVKFWPEWFVHKAPKFNGKIKIDKQLSE